MIMHICSIYPNSSNKLCPRILTQDRLLPISFLGQVQHIHKLKVLNSLYWNLHFKQSKKVWHLNIGLSVHRLWTFFAKHFWVLQISRAGLIWRIRVHILPDCVWATISLFNFKMTMLLWIVLFKVYDWVYHRLHKFLDLEIQG